MGRNQILHPSTMRETNSFERIYLALKSQFLVTTIISLGSAVVYAQTPSAIDPIANCIECHGTNGIGNEPDFPHLNGMPEHLLTAMIEGFRKGKRPLKVRLHGEIQEADAILIARHYGAQKAIRPKQEVQPNLVARGQSLHEQRCADCHLDNGRDSDKDAPLTAAQSLTYLIAQSLAFMTGERKFPYLMDEAYRGLSKDDLTAIAHFFAAQDQEAPKTRRRRRR